MSAIFSAFGSYKFMQGHVWVMHCPGKIRFPFSYDMGAEVIIDG